MPSFLNLNFDQINLYVQLFQAIEAGVLNVVGGFKAIIKALHPGASDEELNAIEDGIKADAAKRQAERDQMK